MSQYGPIEIRRRIGNESFHDEGRSLGYDLLSFWQWSVSDVVSNATRGILAEYLVAQVLGVADNVRDEWAPYDIMTLDGIKIEVKSAAYIQSWNQKCLSKIVFHVPKTRAWDKITSLFGKDTRRQADVYVFAILAHTDQKTLDPLDVSQWEFFVVPTLFLDNRKRSQHSITLRSLEALAGKPVSYSALKNSIEEAGRIQRDMSAEGNTAEASK